MKTTLQYIVLLLLFTNCKAQHNPQQTITMKTFDIETFNKHKNHLNEYTFVTRDSVIIEQSQWHSGYDEVIKYKDSYIQTYNKYYDTGALMLTGNFYPNDFEKGIWREYDEQGHLIKETDYDAPYKFTWEDILAFIKKRNIDMSAYGFRVGRNIVNDKPIWAIVYNKDEKKMILGVIGIDGTTGEILSETERDYPIEE